MIFPFLLALVAFAALLPILAPLLRGSRPVAARSSFDKAVYRDQLQELDRDIARGLITQAEADIARLEIQRRLLTADRLPPAAPRLARSPILAAMVFVIVAGGSIGIYLRLGTPGLPDEPFAGRKRDIAEEHSPAALQQATAALAEKLKQNPSDYAGWVLYGRSLAMLAQWDQAEEAYHRAIDLGASTPEVLGDHAEIMVMQAAGTVTPAAAAAFTKVLNADPTSGVARYYLALATMQGGEPRKAIAGFQALLAELPTDSPVRVQIGQKVTEAARQAGIPVPELANGTPPQQTPADPAQAPGPDAKAVADAANLTDEQRQAMVRTMVANLAAKQEADPDNVDGWLRLGRAYSVLHEADKAADAYEKAAKLRPDDVSIPLQEVRALLSEHAPADKLPPRVISLLKQIEAMDAEQPLVLWYLGMEAAQEGHPDDARRYWGKLLTKLPPGDDSKIIQAAIDALPNQH